MLEFGISYGAFGSAILGCLPPEGDSWVVPPKSDDGVWKGREDLRELTICSIDPPGLFYTISHLVRLLTYGGTACQDIDDALHARPLPNGNIEAGVR